MIDLMEKVLFLRDPASYPHATTRVEAKETHMSWVFLADDRVYKLKKPVKYPFLDFSTLSHRHFYCAEELRLNRKLAGETYRTILPLCRDGAGHLNLSGRGKVVDWLVEMERLSETDMLETRLCRGVATREDIRRIGERMGGFYAACAPQVADGYLYIENLVGEQAINRAILERPELGVREAAGPALDVVDRALKALIPVIEQRIAAGRLVEGHGDLRPEHIYLGEPAQIIDCLEFNRAMRIIDPYDEINYLGLECAVRGAAWVRPILLDVVEARLGGRPTDEVLALYGGFRALLRARLCMAHLLDAVVLDPDKWKPEALSYIAMASGELSLPCRSAR